MNIADKRQKVKTGVNPVFLSFCVADSFPEMEYSIGKANNCLRGSMF